jgi:phage FluMu protein Com
MQDIRCEKCNKLLYRVDRPQRTVLNEGNEVVISGMTPQDIGTIECKCPRCGTVNTNKESVNGTPKRIEKRG